MRIELPAGMEQRLPNPSRSSCQTPLNHPRKNKRRSSRRSNLLDTISDTWPNSPQSNQDSGLVAGMEYSPQMLWQSTGMPQNVPSNGQRLFTAMSDPSVCSYSPVPVTYTMQPVSLPTMYRMYQPMPMPNIRTVHSRHRHHCNKHLMNVRPNANNNVVNGYGSLRENGVLESTVHIAHQNGDYASLPPTANKDSGVNGDELNSEHRRYSDPGLGPAENSPRSDSDDSDSVESGSSITTISRSNKLVLSLIEQMTELKKCNSQLFKELTETKSNLENVKAKLAQCKHSTPTDYQPGMLSELIREIREANRNCEEDLFVKVKVMLEERCNQQVKEIDELKNQLLKFIKEKEESDQRVAKLEEEVMALKLSATNEGREIAAFEEETLALRRELQEARASRTLAENHAAKCVNFAVSRSVTPVIFDTPYITSTPVRTALTDTCSLLPAVPPAISSFACSVLRSRSAEVAVVQLVSEAASQCQYSVADSGPVFREDSPRPTNDENDQCSEPSLVSTDTENLYEILSTLELDDLILLDQKETRDVDTRNDSEIKPSTMTKEEKRTKCLMIDTPGAPGDQLLGRCVETNMPSITEKDEAKDLVSSRVLEEQKDVLNNVVSEVERLINYSDDSFWQQLCKFRNQRGSFKKPLRKMGNLRRSFSEFDKLDKDPRQDTKILADTVPTGSSGLTWGNCDTASEDEDYCCPNDDRMSRAITEVPDVVVIGGGSIVPKDLCSTKTLTSRTQTAPSRATYTTAYI